MTDPKFETRAKLEAWARRRAQGCSFDKFAMLEALEDIRRVTLAHQHLENDDG